MTAPPTRPRSPRRNHNLKANPEWLDWLRGYARSKGLPVATLIERVLAGAACVDQYPPPPPR